VKGKRAQPMTSTTLHIATPSHNRSYSPHQYAPFVPKPIAPIKTETRSASPALLLTSEPPPTNPAMIVECPSSLLAAALGTHSPKVENTAPVATGPQYNTSGTSLDCIRNTSSSRTDNNKGEVKNVLDRYHQLFLHETNLVQQLRACDMSSPPTLVKNLGLELHTVLSQKMRELKALVGDDNTQIKECLTPPPLSKQILEKTIGLYVEEQPTGNVVANKYLEPPLVVRTDDALATLAREGRLQVSASLCLTLSDEALFRTLDNKQDILQGHTLVPVSGEGYATFNKLKIMEVSSKHHHQAFSIQLQLQEICNAADGSVGVYPIGELLKLAPLHVQSRINKRKRGCLSGHGRPRKRARGESDCNYVDITPLLVLPQKEAATRLGISESMLCKRFKECTRRKWPYRYLRKIDKMIRVLTINKKSDAIPREDQEKIQRLKREREECLHPVKIRITGHDKNTSRNIVSGNSGNFSDKIAGKTGKTGGASDSESDPTDSNSSPYEEEEEEGDDEEEEYEEEDEISQVASTLNLLKKGGF